MPTHRSRPELQAHVDAVRASPSDVGTVEMIVVRPAEDERLTPDMGEFDLQVGLIGDVWRADAEARAGDGEVDIDGQIAVMNSRYLDVIAGDRARWALAGDQLVVDLDLSDDNLVAGDRLEAGSAVFEVTAKPHNGCAKFRDRFGLDAVQFANSEIGKALHLRGIYVRVVQPGSVSVGDSITVLRHG